MNRFSIIFILITVLITLDIVTIKIFDLFIFGFIFLLSYIIFFFVIKKIGEYFRRRKAKKEFELLIKRLDNELKKISSDKLRTEKNNDRQKHVQRFEHYTELNDF